MNLVSKHHILKCQTKYSFLPWMISCTSAVSLGASGDCLRESQYHMLWQWCVSVEGSLEVRFPSWLLFPSRDPVEWGTDINGTNRNADRRVKSRKVQVGTCHSRDPSTVEEVRIFWNKFSASLQILLFAFKILSNTALTGRDIWAHTSGHGNNLWAGPSGRAVWDVSLDRLDAETVGLNPA
jgi:hypothetical protein